MTLGTRPDRDQQAQHVGDDLYLDAAGIPTTLGLVIESTKADLPKSKQGQHILRRRGSVASLRRNLCSTIGVLLPWRTGMPRIGSERLIALRLSRRTREIFIKGTTEQSKKANDEQVNRADAKDGDAASKGSKAGSILRTPPPKSEAARSSPATSNVSALPTAKQPRKTPTPVGLRTPIRQNADILSPPSKKRRMASQTLSVPGGTSNPAFPEHSSTKDAADKSVPAEGSVHHDPVVTPFSVFNKRLEDFSETARQAQRTREFPVIDEESRARGVATAAAYLNEVSSAKTKTSAAQMTTHQSETFDATASMCAPSGGSEVPKGKEQTPQGPVHSSHKDRPSLNATEKHFPDNDLDSINAQASDSDEQDQDVDRYSDVSVGTQETSIDKSSITMASPQSQSPSPTAPARFSQGSQLPDCTLSPADIAAHIPPEGIKLKDLQILFTEDELPNNRKAKQRFVKLVREVASNVKDLYYLKSGSQQSAAQLSQMKGGKSSPQKAEMALNTSRKGKLAAASLPRGQKVETKTEKGTAEEERSVKCQVSDAVDSEMSKETPRLESEQARFSTPTTVVDPAKRDTREAPDASSIRVAFTSDTPPPPAVATTKRPASTMTTSRESTPSSKKLRSNNLSAQKEALLKGLREKQARRATAQTDFAEKEKRRQAEEELLLAAQELEIKMLERQGAEEDEAYERLVQAGEEEEEAMREARTARGMAEEAVRVSEGL